MKVLMLYRVPLMNRSIQQQNSKMFFLFYRLKKSVINPKHCKEKSREKTLNGCQSVFAVYFDVLSSFKTKCVCYLSSYQLRTCNTQCRCRLHRLRIYPCSSSQVLCGCTEKGDSLFLLFYIIFFSPLQGFFFHKTVQSHFKHQGHFLTKGNLLS